MLAFRKPFDGLYASWRRRLAWSDQAPGPTIPPRAASRTHDEGEICLCPDKRVAIGRVLPRIFGNRRASAALAIAVSRDLGAGDVVAARFASPGSRRPLPYVASSPLSLCDSGRSWCSGHVAGGGGKAGHGGGNRAHHVRGPASVERNRRLHVYTKRGVEAGRLARGVIRGSVAPDVPHLVGGLAARGLAMGAGPSKGGLAPRLGEPERVEDEAGVLPRGREGLEDGRGVGLDHVEAVPNDVGGPDEVAEGKGRDEVLRRLRRLREVPRYWELQGLDGGPVRRACDKGTCRTRQPADGRRGAGAVDVRPPTDIDARRRII